MTGLQIKKAVASEGSLGTPPDIIDWHNLYHFGRSWAMGKQLSAILATWPSQHRWRCTSSPLIPSQMPNSTASCSEKLHCWCRETPKACLNTMIVEHFMSPHLTSLHSTCFTAIQQGGHNSRKVKHIDEFQLTKTLWWRWTDGDFQH